MIKSIMNGLGAVAAGAAKIASAIKNSTAFKVLKFAASATVGVPLALVGTAITSVAWTGIKVAGLLDAKIIKGVFGSSIWEDTAWASSLQGTEKFMRSLWEDFGVYAHLNAAKFIGDEWAKRQSEAGYGDARDDPENVGNYAAFDNEARTEEVENKVKQQDDIILSQTDSTKFDPTKIDKPPSPPIDEPKPSPACYPKSAYALGAAMTMTNVVGKALKFTHKAGIDLNI